MWRDYLPPPEPEMWARDKAAAAAQQ